MVFTRNNYPHFHPVAMATAFSLSVISPSVWSAPDPCALDSSLIVNIIGEDITCNENISLREAIIYANNNPPSSGRNTVTFASSLNGSTIITNNNEPIFVTNGIIIDGMTAEDARITLIAPASGQLFNIDSANSVGIDFDLKNVTLEQAGATDHIISMTGYGDIVLDNIHTTDATIGYGIFDGNGRNVLDPLNVTLKNSQISGSAFDEQIIGVDSTYSSSNVNIAIENSTISSANAEALVTAIDDTNSYSGDISNITISIDNTHIDGGVWDPLDGIIDVRNRGGSGSTASVVVLESSIKNVDSNDGSIVHARGADGEINITDSEITGNNEGNGDTTRVAVSAEGVDVDVQNSLISGNGSAAIAISNVNYYGEDTSLSVKNTTISGNITSQVGSAISIDGTYGSLTSTVLNSTISGNQTADNNNNLDAAIEVFAGKGSGRDISFSLENSTVSNNSTTGYGGGIILIGDTANITANINNSIVAGNVGSGSDSDNDIFGAFNINYSLIGDTSTLGGTIITGDNNIVDQDPMLQELTLSGGAWVHLLEVSSPAIAAGNVETPELPEFDQRGVGFDRVRDTNRNSELDMGAVQYFAGPVAVSDVFSVELNSENNLLNVLSNDTANSNGSLLDLTSVTIMEHPDNGSADTQQDGVITYTPNADFAGDDILRYVVRDMDGNYSLEATVTITVAEDDIAEDDIAEDDIAEESVTEKSKSGGAFHFWLLSLLGVFGLRRKS
jgi:hypothetical protein